MLLYYDRESRKALYTLRSESEFRPAGDFVEIPDDFAEDLASLEVIDGVALVVDLAPVRAAAIGRINTRSGEARSRYITTTPGQEMIYLRKETEAARFITDGAPADLTDFPFLLAEIGITTPTADELAQLWLNLAHLWRQVGSQIETLRLGAIRDIVAATDARVVESVLSDFDMQLDALPPAP